MAYTRFLINGSSIEQPLICNSMMEHREIIKIHDLMNIPKYSCIITLKIASKFGKKKMSPNSNSCIRAKKMPKTKHAYVRPSFLDMVIA